MTTPTSSEPRILRLYAAPDPTGAIEFLSRHPRLPGVTFEIAEQGDGEIAVTVLGAADDVSWALVLDVFKKALEATRSLGPDGFSRAFAELHRADVGIKGATGLPEGAVLEITVARLANLHRGGGRGSSAGARGRSRRG